MKEVIIKLVSCETILFTLGAVSNVQMFGPISSTFRWDHSTKNSAADPIFTETWSLLYLSFLFFCEKRFVVVCIILTSAFSTSHSSFVFFFFFGFHLLQQNALTVYPQIINEEKLENISFHQLSFKHSFSLWMFTCKMFARIKILI